MIEIGKASIAAVLATCGLFGWACNPAAADVRIEGLVQVGGGAVANSTVTLWAAGSGEPRQLAQAQTGNDGHFVLGSQVSTPQDNAEAVKWYRKAADQGYADAQFNLGFMYKEGLGVQQDYVQAHMWFSLAATTGDRGAAESRDNVANLMTPPQIAEAQKLAREWKPKPERP